jgi:processive 1,2-diacylglycerol beta-glucosyltransferase
MYISEVSGHHSATLAIEKSIKILSPKTEVLNINAFNYTNPISEKIVNRIYLGLIKRTPGIWDYLYDNPNVVKKIQNLKESIHKVNSPKLKNLFDKFKPDAVLCTQAFPCGMVADFKKTYNSDLPLVAVLTDYAPHSYWIYEQVNYFITPSDDVSLRLMKKGVALKRIKPLGIPFDPKFNQPVEKNKVFQKFKLKPNQPTVLIMGGGQGLGPIKTIIKSLEKVNQGIQEIVIAGTNKKLFNSLQRKIKKYKKKIILLGFTDDIDELMAISDIIITKPGGVTTAEVLAKRLPMVIVKPIPGQEANNTSYLTQKQAAIKVDDPKETNLVVQDLLVNPDKLNRLRESSASISKPNASLDIAGLLLDLSRV